MADDVATISVPLRPSGRAPGAAATRRQGNERGHSEDRRRDSPSPAVSEDHATILTGLAQRGGVTRTAASDNYRLGRADDSGRPNRFGRPALTQEERIMPRARLTALVAALAAVCALTAPAIAPLDRRPRARPRPSRSPAPPRWLRPQRLEAFSASPLRSARSRRWRETTTDPDVAFQHLLENLSPGAPFQLRLGGVSADTSWWAVPGMKPPRYLSTLTPRWAANFKALLTAVGGKTILGVNLEEDPDISQAIASAEVAGFNRYIGPNLIQAFELGNEPEYFPLSVVNGGRGHDTIAAYGKKFSQIAAQLGGAPLAGPASVGDGLAGRVGHGPEPPALAPERGDRAPLPAEELLARRAPAVVAAAHPAPRSRAWPIRHMGWSRRPPPTASRSGWTS